MKWKINHPEEINDVEVLSKKYIKEYLIKHSDEKYYSWDFIEDIPYKIFTKEFSDSSDASLFILKYFDKAIEYIDVSLERMNLLTDQIDIAQGVLAFNIIDILTEYGKLTAKQYESENEEIKNPIIIADFFEWLDAKYPDKPMMPQIIEIKDYIPDITLEITWEDVIKDVEKSIAKYFVENVQLFDTYENQILTLQNSTMWNESYSAGNDRLNYLVALITKPEEIAIEFQKFVEVSDDSAHIMIGASIFEVAFDEALSNFAHVCSQFDSFVKKIDIYRLKKIYDVGKFGPGFLELKTFLDEEENLESEVLKSLTGLDKNGYPNVKFKIVLESVKESDQEDTIIEEIFIETAKLNLKIKDDENVIYLTFPTEYHEDFENLVGVILKWREYLKNIDEYEEELMLYIHMFSYEKEEYCATAIYPYQWNICSVYPESQRNTLKFYCYKIDIAE